VRTSPWNGPISPEEVERGRLLAAIAYLPGLCFIGLLGMPENPFVAFHARQGFLLLCLEVVVWLALWIFDASLGRIPVAGFLIGAILHFVCGIALLGATVYGVIKAAVGETARVPVLGEYVERVPF
jgi:uncharacterized membrane protein